MIKATQLITICQDVSDEKWSASQGQAKGLVDVGGATADDKDIARIMDIVDKSNGDPKKMMMYVTNMAKSITSKDKAQRRAAAAMDLLPPEIANDAASTFLAKW